MDATPDYQPQQAIRVWDLPTRVFHWLLASAVLGAVVSAEIGGNAMPWHQRFGLLVMALVLFRVLWGVVGGRWSRFASFIYAPTTVLRYAKGQTSANEHLDVGHNPLGSLSVFGLLGMLAVQVATGLVADDEIASTGPLNRFITTANGLLATSWHKDIGKFIVLTLVALHIGAIAFYFFRKKVNLVRPMWTGDKTLPASTPASADAWPQRVLAVLLGAACAGVAMWVASLAA
jgi:cytochrome b